MNRVFAPLLLSAAFVAGCAALETSPTAGALSVQPRVSEGGYRSQTAAVVAPYLSGDINHLVIALFKLDNGAETPVVGPGLVPVRKDIEQASLSVPVTFYNLHPNTTYRIRAFAYKATGEATDDLISTTDSASYKDVRVETSLTPSIEQVPVKLINKLFKAEATSSIVVTDGTLTNENEAIVAPD
ncbi:hypothetical protein D3C86_1064660 [compost metagenome]